MEGELGGSFSRRTDPDAATKGAEIGEIVLVLGRARDWGIVGALDGKGIVDPETQIESVGLKLCVIGTTK